MQTIPDFAHHPEQYALHNARPESIDFMWNGLRFTVPGFDEIGSKPARFPDGTAIPGTLVVQDSYAVGPDGHIPLPGTAFNWKAKDAISNVLGIEVHTGQAAGKAASNGLSFIPVICTPAQYEEVKTSGQGRYRESLIAWATETIEAHEQARNKAKEAGVNPKPPGPEYYRAIQIKKLADEALRKDLGVEQDLLQQESVDDEIAFKAYAYAYAEKIARPIAEEQEVDKVKIIERMLEDPKVAAGIRKKYSLRKRGYMDPAVSPGAEQPPTPEDAA